MLAMGTLVLEYLSAFLGFLSAFHIVRIAILTAIVAGLWFAVKRTRFDDATRIKTFLILAGSLVAWFVLVWQLALAGAFAQPLGPVPVVAVAAALPPLVAIPLLVRWQQLAAVLDATPPSWLVGVQVYRLFGATFLVQWLLGRLPTVFLPAGVGDLLVGVLALLTAYLLSTGMRSARSVAIAWNVFGLLDVLVAVGLALLAGSRVGYPVVLTPTFSAPLAVILHALSLWQLKRLAQGARAPAMAALSAAG
jgi:hypothetical protein